MTSAIQILNGLGSNVRQLGLLARAVESTFGVPVSVVPSDLQIGRAFDQSRKQYNSTALLALLFHHSGTQDAKRILVLDVDLFIPILTFVFGEAQLEGKAAVVSTHRLRNEYYGLPGDERVTASRLEKEIIHELGHTFGLYHCRQFECVMRSSTYVEEIDLKKADLCSTCVSMLRQSRG